MIRAGFAYSPTTLTIDLDAIVSNWQRIKAETQHGRASAVIKADGYGCGLSQVGLALAAAGCDTFFVAHLDEAIALADTLEPWAEAKGIRRPRIAVLNGLMPREAPIYRARGLWPVLNDLGQIAYWKDEAAKADTGPLSAILHVDTGMNRTGLDRSEAEALSADHSLTDGIALRFVMSHMACADAPGHPMNDAQRERFSDIIACLPKAAEGAMLAASSATFLGPDWHFDWVRPGVGMFGGRPNTDAPNPLKPVVRLDAKILQTRQIDAHETVGYGAAHTATTPAKIATIAVGYADGYMRYLSARSKAWIGGVEVPVVGRVSMDLITLDVTHLPNVSPGDAVTLIGSQPGQTVDDLADLAGTIGYEVLTSLGARYRRAYIGGIG